jgi:hypothetical protein
VSKATQRFPSLFKGAIKEEEASDKSLMDGEAVGGENLGEEQSRVRPSPDEAPTPLEMGNVVRAVPLLRGGRVSLFVGAHSVGFSMHFSRLCFAVWEHAHTLSGVLPDISWPLLVTFPEGMARM